MPIERYGDCLKTLQHKKTPPALVIGAGGVRLRVVRGASLQLQLSDALSTLDGLKIDENMRVLDAEQNPIEGLFAVGNCSGGMYAGSYPELLIGNANCRTGTFGRHAVRYILGEVK